MIGIVDIKEQLANEKQLEDLRENIKARQKDLDKVIVQLMDIKRCLALSLKSLKLKGCIK